MVFALFLSLTHRLFILMGNLLVVVNVFGINVDFIQALFETTDGFTHGLTQLWQTAWTEEDQKDNCKKQNVRKAKLTHGVPPKFLKVYTF